MNENDLTQLANEWIKGKYTDLDYDMRFLLKKAYIQGFLDAKTIESDTVKAPETKPRKWYEYEA